MEHEQSTSRTPLPGPEWFERNWHLLLFTGAVALVAGTTVLRFVQEPYRIHEDSALFQHAGWYILDGATPYVDFWDLKPPLIYAVTTALAFVAGGDMHVLHLLGVAVAVGSVVGGVTLVGLLAHRLTDDAVAGFVAGASMFVVPSLYRFPVAGIRPKYLALLFGALGLYLALEDRPASGGAAVAASAGFWQLAGPLAALVVGLGFQRGGRRGLVRTIGGGLLVTVLVVAPFVVAGLTVPLFLEVVLAPVYGVERYTVPGRLLDVVLNLGYGILLLPIGVYGWLRGLSLEPERYWWVAAGGAIYVLQIFLELQGAIELIFLLLFVALGVGVVIARASTPSRQSAVAVVVAALAVASLYWAAGPVTPVRDEAAALDEEVSISNYESLPAKPDEIDSMETIYWEKQRPEHCHYRLGQKQREYADRTGESLLTSECGQWPFDEPPRRWLVESVR